MIAQSRHNEALACATINSALASESIILRSRFDQDTCRIRNTLQLRSIISRLKNAFCLGRGGEIALSRLAIREATALCIKVGVNERTFESQACDTSLDRPRASPTMPSGWNATPCLLFSLTSDASPEMWCLLDHNSGAIRAQTFLATVRVIPRGGGGVLAV